MAATPAGHSRDWIDNSISTELRPRTHSQPAPRQHKGTSKATGPSNTVKSKPADPRVISSILSSLETLAPPGVVPSEYYVATRPYSSTSTLPTTNEKTGTMPALSGSGGYGGVRGGVGGGGGGSFGLESPGSASLYEDDDFESDAAMPPVVRTSRAPMRPSSQSMSRSSSFLNGTARDFMNIGSRTSSRPASLMSNRSDEAKGSGQSWKQKSMSQESVASSTLRKQPRGLRRIETLEKLRPAYTTPEKLSHGISHSPTSIMPQSPIDEVATSYPAPELSTDFVSASPLRRSSKPRLNLGWKSFKEETPLSDPLPDMSPLPSPTGSPRNTDKQLGENAEDQSPRLQLRKSSINDSIPMRTSSLNYIANSKPRKKERKIKRKALASDNVATAVPVGFKDSTHLDPVEPAKPAEGPNRASTEQDWSGLGEDDVTVRRIKELQNQRAVRLRESKVYGTNVELNLPKEAGVPPPISPIPIVHEHLDPRDSWVRPITTRAITDPSTKARRILGLAVDRPLPARVPTYQPRSVSPSPETPKSATFSPETNIAKPTAKATSMDSQRPQTSTSVRTSPLLLDYSYVQAVDALQKASRNNTSYEPTGSKRTPNGQRESIDSTPASTSNSDSRLSRRLSATLPHRGPPRNRNSLDVPTQARPNSIAPTRSRSQARKTGIFDNLWSPPAVPVPEIPQTQDVDRKKSRRKSMSDARNTKLLEAEQALSRRNSVEDAVDTYLRSPRLSRKVQHPMTGRVISYSEVGDPDGAAVFVCVGMGLTRYVTAFYDELATTLRLRLITPERPGVGGSDPYPSNDRSGPLSWPEDILAICEALDITRFSILAHSAGAIYAFATALILPQFVRGKIHLLAPWIPPSQLEPIHHSTSSITPAGVLPRSQRFLRVLPTPFLKVANSSFINATSASLKPAGGGKQSQRTSTRTRQAALSPTRSPVPHSYAESPTNARHRESLMLMDQYMPATNPLDNFPLPNINEPVKSRPQSILLTATATPTDPEFDFAATHLNAAEHTARERQSEYTKHLTQRTWDLATRDSNPAVDLLVCLERHRDVGFRYVDVGCEVVITHGAEDKRVPLGNVKWLAEQMNRRARVGAGARSSATALAYGGRDDYDRARKGGCEVRVLEGQDHGLMASALIMGDVLTEIAGYAVVEERELRGASR